jgi:hypothetical protein
MKPIAAFANSLWIASCFPAWRSFSNALQRPAPVQQEWLRRHLARNAGSEFVREHKLATVKSYKEFSQRVPLQEYESLAPWIERIRRGAANVLTCDQVTHLIPTSGSTGARKLIPFTAGLQRDFDRAIAPWVFDLSRQHPGILGGPAYWSISPISSYAPSQERGDGAPSPSGKRDAHVANFGDSVRPAPGTARPRIGFADDASYLGGVKSWLVRAATIAPPAMNPATDVQEFRHATLLCLLRQRDLRLISVWHPSFLGLLLDALPGKWEKLLADIHKTQKYRARELERADPRRPELLWPQLKVISCWGDAHAGLALDDLRRRFPQTHLQPKGLLATEAFTTIPFQRAHPVAVCSHFFEFIDGPGQVRRVHELCEGETYEVVVTTGGGLWRYRLGDLVQAQGKVGETPSLRFIGRSGNVSDRFGEKLSECFVGEVIREALAGAPVPPRFAMLAPDDGTTRRYVLYLEGDCEPELAARVDDLLRRNPHYARCRDLGQLQAVEVFQIRRRGYETFVTHETARGHRLGEIKASPLSREPGWSARFEGAPSLDKIAAKTQAHASPG